MLCEVSIRGPRLGLVQSRMPQRPPAAERSICGVQPPAAERGFGEAAK